jgi:hypothetical protein
MQQLAEMVSGGRLSCHRREGDDQESENAVMPNHHVDCLGT